MSATPIRKRLPATGRVNLWSPPLASLRVFAAYMLGGWVNPHREQQTRPQGQTSIPPKYFFTPTAKARPDQAALPTSAEAGSHTASTASESKETVGKVCRRIDYLADSINSDFSSRLNQRSSSLHAAAAAWTRHGAGRGVRGLGFTLSPNPSTALQLHSSLRG